MLFKKAMKIQLSVITINNTVLILILKSATIKKATSIKSIVNIIVLTKISVFIVKVF